MFQSIGESDTAPASDIHLGDHLTVARRSRWGPPYPSCAAQGMRASGTYDSHQVFRQTQSSVSSAMLMRQQAIWTTWTCPSRWVSHGLDSPPSKAAVVHGFI